MKLYTDRNLLYIYPALDFHNPHKKNYPLPLTKNDITVYNAYWGADEYMLIDVLADKIRKGFYQKIKVDSKNIRNTQSLFDKEFVNQLVENSLPDNLILKFDIQYKEIRRMYPFMSKYPPKQFAHLVDRTSRMKLKTSYKVKLSYENRDNHHDIDTDRHKTSKKKINEKIAVEFRSPQNLFNYSLESEDGIYKILFNTGLGVSFVNNMKMFEWERLPFEFYNFSKNAQNFYRRAMLPRKQGTKVEYALGFIADYLNFNSPNQKVQSVAVERVLNELKNREFIEWEKKKGYRETIFSIEKAISN